MKTNHQRGDLDTIVFENRNKNYGAYVLRKGHDNRVIFAFFIASTLLFLGFYSPVLIRKLSNDPPVVPKEEIQLWDTIQVDNSPEKPKEKKTEIEKPKTDPAPKTKTQDVITKISENANPIDSTRTVLNDEIVSYNPDPGNDGTGKDPGPSIENYHLEVKKEKPPIIAPDIMPEFPGGEAALLRFYKLNVRYPEGAKDRGLEGTVYINFIIEEDGSVSAVKTLKGIGMGCEEEVIRVAGKMPRWKPGKNNGEPVRVSYNLPVRFILK